MAFIPRLRPSGDHSDRHSYLFRIPSHRPRGASAHPLTASVSATAARIILIGLRLGRTLSHVAGTLLSGRSCRRHRSLILTLIWLRRRIIRPVRAVWRRRGTHNCLWWRRRRAPCRTVISQRRIIYIPVIWPVIVDRRAIVIISEIARQQQTRAGRHSCECQC